MKAPQTAVVIGATGLVGSLLVQHLLADDAYNKVRILVRKPVALQHPKLQIELVNFDNLQDFKNKLGKGDAIFSCIGTTQKNVGNNKNAYRQIDFDIPLNAAKFGKENGFITFCLVSSVGASATSSTFYLQLKGSLEEALNSLNYTSLNIFRPAMILGDRKERRSAEKILQKATVFLSYFFVGGLRKYKSIQATTIAKAMVQAAKNPQDGMHVYEYDAITKLAGAKV